MRTVSSAHRAPVPQPGCRVVLCPLFLRAASSEHSAVFADLPRSRSYRLGAAAGSAGRDPPRGRGLCQAPPTSRQATPPRRRGGRRRQGALRGRGALAAFGVAVSSRRAQALSWPRGFVPSVLWARISEANPVWSYGAEAGRRVDADIIGLSLLINRAALIHRNK